VIGSSKSAETSGAKPTIIVKKVRPLPIESVMAVTPRGPEVGRGRANDGRAVRKLRQVGGRLNYWYSVV
jgi:hypothetical protein